MANRIYFVRHPNERRIEFFHDGLRDGMGITLEVPNADPGYAEAIRMGSIFLCSSEKDHERLMKVLAESNPGCAVECYTMESSAQTSVGPIVVKEVSKDGILPSEINF